MLCFSDDLAWWTNLLMHAIIESQVFNTTFFLAVCWEVQYCTTTSHHNHFTALFRDHPGEPMPEKLLDFIVHRKINRGRHTDHHHPAGRHSIRTNQCPPPSSPIFLQARCPSCHPTNSVKALKATSAFTVQYCNNFMNWCSRDNSHPPYCV